MNNSEDFTMEQSEELIAQLKTNSPSGFTQLHSSLKLLSHVSELSPVAMPPLLPSAVDQPIESITLRRPRTYRPAITSLIVTAVLASASFAAAGVTGRGPAVIVEAAKKSGEIVANVVGTVGNTLTGNNDQPSAPSGTENSHSIPKSPGAVGPSGPAITPSSQEDQTSNGDGNDQNSSQTNSDDGDSEHPTVTPDPSPTPKQRPSHTSLPNNGTGVNGLVLPPVTNDQSDENSGESEHESENESENESD